MKQWRNNFAEWHCGDTLYLSVVFSWDLEAACQRAAQWREKHKRGNVIAGGPAITLARKRRTFPIDWCDTPDSVPFDTLAFHNPCATFTTRGCFWRCGFCAVPELEGPFVVLDKWKPAPLVCDNNILAADTDDPEHFSRVIVSMQQFPYCDFNQGLDARLFQDHHARKLATLQGVTVRFACDSHAEEPEVARSIAVARKEGLRDISVYSLIGFKDTPDEALDRMNILWDKHKVEVCPMRYQPIITPQRDSYVDPNWTDGELSLMARFFWRRRFWRDQTYAQWKAAQAPLFQEATNGH